MLASKSTFIVLISAFVLCSLLLRSDEVFAGEKDSASELKLEGGFHHFKYGPKRNNTFVPDEIVHFSATLFGFSIGLDEKPKFTITVVAFAKNGKKILMTGPVQVNELAGSYNKTKYLITYDLRFDNDISPGKHTLQFRITDKLSQRHVEGSWPFTILPLSTFTAYDIRLSNDPENQNLDSNFTVGNMLYVQCKIAGSMVKNEQVSIKGVVTYYDQNMPDKPLGSSTFSQERKLPKYGKVVPSIDSKAIMDSPGYFVVKLELEDLYSGKKSVHFIPFTVHEPAGFDISAFGNNQIPAEAVKRKPAKRLR